MADYRTFFAEMSVDAISMLGDDMSVSSVGIKKAGNRMLSFGNWEFGNDVLLRVWFCI